MFLRSLGYSLRRFSEVWDILSETGPRDGYAGTYEQSRLPDIDVQECYTFSSFLKNCQELSETPSLAA